jgi:hypothetical protein
MEGPMAAINEFNATANSGGTHALSQTGIRRASIASGAPVKVPALSTVHAASEWNAQAASDQSIKRLTTTNQLMA